MEEVVRRKNWAEQVHSNMKLDEAFVLDACAWTVLALYKQYGGIEVKEVFEKYFLSYSKEYCEIGYIS